MVSARPIVGFGHRGAEKLFEARDYRQAMALANRHDWHNAINGELGVALAVEAMTGIVVPERAVWLRMALVEVNRLLSHLAFLIGTAYQDPASAAVSSAAQARRRLVEVMEMATGNRLHFMALRVGGVRQDVDQEWTDHLRAALAPLAAVAHDLRNRLTNGELATRLTGLGVIGADLLAPFSMSGVLARACGAPLDLRAQSPYLAYDRIADLCIPVTKSGGDAQARLLCAVEELGTTAAIVNRCLDELDDTIGGPVAVRLPKVLRVPEGSTYIVTEGGLGANGYLLISRGGTSPWRLKIRSASMDHLQVLAHIMPGTDLRDVGLLLQSMFYLTGDVDR